MRRLATFCFAFAAGVFAAEYLLPRWLWLCAAAGCAVLGALWALSFRGSRRRRAALVGAGLAAALCWDWCYVQAVRLPWERMAGSVTGVVMEAADYPSATEYGCRVEVRLPESGLRGRAVYYGDAGLLDLEPGERLTAPVYWNAVRRGDTALTTFPSRGQYALLYARGDAAREPGRVGSPRYFPQRLARRVAESIDGAFPERTRPFLKAILLGDRWELSVEDQTALSEAGLLHVTAVSGLHCAFLLAILTFLVGRDRLRLLSAAAIPVLSLYALTTGLSPSVLRACVMLLLALFAPLFDRENDPPTTLSLALFLILAQNPGAARSVSLQLSFAAMGGLVLLTPRLYRAIRSRKRSRAARFLLGSLAATAGALVFTVPLTAFYFNSLVLAAPLSNLLCLWAASLIFGLGLAAALLGLAFPPAARLLALLPHAGAMYLLTAARFVSALPHHAVYFNNGYLRLWLVYVYAMLLACVLARRGRGRWVMAGGLAALTLAVAVWANTLPLRGGSLHVTALDVGQGQSVVLHSLRSTAVLDCGSSSYLNAGDRTADYLLSAGIRRVDYIVLSHYHDDHCDGLPTLLSRIRAERLLLPDIEPGDPLRESVLALAERHGVPVTFVREKTVLPLGEATLTVYPPLTEGEMNEECLAALCTTGHFDALFTADMDANTEYLLAASYPLPDVEMMMAGHHGSRWSSGGDLLAEVKPELAVVSCGAGNRYGHPNDEALRRLTDAGAAICRTDLQGNIHITVN